MDIQRTLLMLIAFVIIAFVQALPNEELENTEGINEGANAFDQHNLRQLFPRRQDLDCSGRCVKGCSNMSCNINGIEVTTCNRLDILQQMMKTIMAVDHDSRMQKAKVRQRMVELQRKAGGLDALEGGPKRKEEGKSKNFASEADFVKQSLLLWVQNKTASNSYVNVKDFSRSWADGMAFAALVSHFCPGKIPIDKLTPQTRRENFQYAFKVADDEFGVYPLLDVEDMVAMDAPDWKSVFAYVQIMYQAMKGKDPEV